MRHFPMATAVLAFSSLIVAVDAIGVNTATAAEDKHVKSVEGVVSSMGTITAIDPVKRVVTVKNDEGSERTFRVEPGVKSLETAKVGDRVRLDYRVAVAVALRKGGDGIRQKVESEAKSAEPKDGKPHVTAQQRTTIVSNVLAVDRANSTVRLQGPEGRIADFEVKDKAALADVQVGDQVVAVVDEAVAVRVVPAGESKPAASAASPKK